MYCSWCSDVLQKAQEYETDVHIVTLMKLQQTADQLNAIFPLDSPAVEPGYLRPPAFMAIERIHNEMKAIMEAHPPPDETNGKIYLGCSDLVRLLC